VSADVAHYTPDDSALAEAAKAAVHRGDIDRLQLLLAERPELATARIGSTGESRTMLHVATDWPGHFPRVAESIRLLVAAGADVDAEFVGAHTESPLHWAASSDDVDALDALLDAGANIEAPGAVLGGGAPLADACGFGCWNAARRLVERGASTRLKDAAALGMMDRVEEYFTAGSPPDGETVTAALWSASKGRQRVTAQYLIDRGGDVNWIGWDDQTCLDIALAGDDVDFIEWLHSRGAKTANEIRRS
jgi:ankyrin repeat protein